MRAAHTRTRRGLWALSLAILGSASAAGQEPAPGAAPPPASPEPERDPDPYRTPLAGKRLETEVFGRRVVVEERDRTDTIALTLGVTGFAPAIDDNVVVPFFALYANERWKEQRHLRATVSGLVNDVDFAEFFGGPELLLHFDNYTIPFETAELVDGRELDSTKLIWGDLNTRIGLGYRHPVWPGNYDNEVSLGISYEAGYLYFEESNGTPNTAVLPRDTYVHGLRVQGRLDMLQRNIMELPHYGLALGFDLELKHRDLWRDFGNPNLIMFDAYETRDYLKVSGFLAVASPIPWLSERHRLLGQVHAGFSPANDLDRFSAFRVGGGPIASESSDLARNPLPGAMFDQFPVQDFLITTVGYRLELAFWLYLHVRGHYALAKIPTLDRGRLRFRRKQGYMISLAVTSGFLWDSQVSIDATQDLRGVFRGGASGTSIMALWSKSF